jgi:hypothetical protein
LEEGGTGRKAKKTLDAAARYAAFLDDLSAFIMKSAVDVVE